MASISYIHPSISSTIVDNSTTYLTGSGTTKLFAVFTSSKGIDNKVQVMTTTSEYIFNYGEPNMKLYGQTAYNIVNWLDAGGVVYCLRVLPKDATYANALVNIQAKVGTKNAVRMADGVLTDKIPDVTLRPCITYSRSNNVSIDQLKNVELRRDTKTKTVDGYSNYMIFAVVPKGRGEGYNNLGFRFYLASSYDSTYEFRLYQFEVIETSDSGTATTIEGPFLCSLDPDAVSISGQSLFIQTVISKYCTYFDILFAEKNYYALCDLINPNVPAYKIDLISGQTREIDIDTKETYMDSITNKYEDIHMSIMKYDNNGNPTGELNIISYDDSIESENIEIDNDQRENEVNNYNDNYIETKKIYNSLKNVGKGTTINPISSFVNSTLTKLYDNIFGLIVDTTLLDDEGFVKSLDGFDGYYTLSSDVSEQNSFYRYPNKNGNSDDSSVESIYYYSDPSTSTIRILNRNGFGSAYIPFVNLFDKETANSNDTTVNGFKTVLGEYKTLKNSEFVKKAVSDDIGNIIGYTYDFEGNSSNIIEKMSSVLANINTQRVSVIDKIEQLRKSINSTLNLVRLGNASNTTSTMVSLISNISNIEKAISSYQLKWTNLQSEISNLYNVKLVNAKIDSSLANKYEFITDAIIIIESIKDSIDSLNTEKYDYTSTSLLEKVISSINDKIDSYIEGVYIDDDESEANYKTAILEIIGMIEMLQNYLEIEISLANIEVTRFNLEKIASELIDTNGVLPVIMKASIVSFMYNDIYTDIISENDIDTKNLKRKQLLDNIDNRIKSIANEITKSKENMYRNTLADFNNIIKLDYGTDGNFEGKKYTSDEIIKYLVLGYSGQVDTDIVDKDIYQIDMVLDANYPPVVKNTIIDFVTNLRDDCMGILDTECQANPSQAIEYRRNSIGASSFRVAIFTQDFIVEDTSYGCGNIAVTSPYYLASKIPSNDVANGIHYNFVGPRRGVISGFKSISFIPNATYKEALYKARVNYIESDQVSTRFGSQLTSQSQISALSNISCVRALLRIQREVEDLMKNYQFEYNDDTTINAANSALNNYLSQWVTNRCCQSITGSVYSNEYDKIQKMLRVKIELVFTSIIERIAIELVVNQ